MKPNPRSETNFLMVPVGISPSLPSRKNVANARALSRSFDDRGAHRPPSGRLIYLTTGAWAVLADQRASKATPTNVARAPDSFIAAPLVSRSLHTPQIATPTTAVSRTGATTERGARLRAHNTS